MGLESAILGRQVQRLHPEQELQPGPVLMPALREAAETYPATKPVVEIQAQVEVLQIPVLVVERLVEARATPVGVLRLVEGRAVEPRYLAMPPVTRRVLTARPKCVDGGNAIAAT